MALHVNAGDEEPSRAILARFASAASLDVRNVRWAPYRKTGRHSRLTFLVVLPVPDADAAVAEIDRICAVLDPHGEALGETIAFEHDDGAGRHYERILKREPGRRLFPRANWADIEINTYPPAQAALRRQLRRYPAVGPETQA